MSAASEARAIAHMLDVDRSSIYVMQARDRLCALADTLELPALVLTDGEQTGLRNLLNELGAGAADMTIALERRGLTNPLIATCETPGAGEASFLIALGVFVELDGYPPKE